MAGVEVTDEALISYITLADGTKVPGVTLTNDGRVIAIAGEIGGLSIAESSISAIKSSQLPIFEKMVQHNTNWVSSAGEINITSWGSGWYNYYYNLSELRGQTVKVSIVDTGTVDNNAEFYTLEDLPTGAGNYKTSFRILNTDSITFEVPMNANYLLINNKYELEAAFEVVSTGFRLSKDGSITAQKGKIGNLNITKLGLETGNVSLRSDCLKIGNNKLTNSGLECNKITATS
jgi:hypothetical protein